MVLLFETVRPFVIVTRHTLVWKSILAAVFFSLSSYRYFGDGGTDRREILRHGTYRSRTDLLPFWGRYSQDPQIRNFGPNFEYRENVKSLSQHYMSIKA